jgi:NAD(P)-dependent dehydrogenase (short-subunit alcohol dehydrogenase family)
MTKAALNMLTRTAAKDFISDNIFMNAVDVGWISTGAPEIKRKKLFDNLQIPPLDAVDGALRILHPIEEILQKRENWYGVLLKNYAIVNW